jgi:hypothetical protein
MVRRLELDMTRLSLQQKRQQKPQSHELDEHHLNQDTNTLIMILRVRFVDIDWENNEVCRRYAGLLQ